MVERLKALWSGLQESTPYRAWDRYSAARGNLLAGGVTYFAFFSIFPAVALAFTVFGIVLQGHESLLDDVRTYLNSLLPGFIKEGDTGLIPLEAPTSATLSVTGVLGVLGLLWAGLGWLSGLRDGIRSVLGVGGEPGNFFTNKARDVGVLLLLGVGIVLSAVVTTVAGASAAWVADLVGLGGASWVLAVVGAVVGVLLDGVIVLVMLRLLSGVRFPWPALRRGALFGGIALTVLKMLGANLLGAMNNPLYASIALVVGLLAWLNLMSRAVLLSAAYAGTPGVGEPAAVPLSEGVQDKLLEGPAPAPDGAGGVTAGSGGGSIEGASGFVTPGRSGPDRAGAVDQRAQDRANLALGGLAGFAGATVLGILVGARRAAGRRWRRS